MLCKLFALREAALAPSRRRLTMTEHILQAYRIDIETRTNSEGDQRRNPEGWKVNAHEIKSGVIYKDAKVTSEPSPRSMRWRATDIDSILQIAAS